VDTRCFVLNSPTVIGEAIDGEVMVINLVSGIYYNLTGTGAAAWPLLAAGVPVHAIVSALSASSAADPAALAGDFQAFVDRLIAESILRVAAPDALPAVVAQQPVPARYTGFDLHRYDDMRALLVVDPVHEVGDFGWPPPAEPARKPG
jgi:hypothetical protein